MKPRYTKKQILEAIDHWQNVLENTNALQERYEISDPYFQKNGTYLYVVSNPAFGEDIVKIGYSDGESLKVHLTRYNTAVPDQYVPIALIFFDNETDIAKLEKEFMKMFTKHEGNGGIEFFDSSKANAVKQATDFARKHGAEMHVYSMIHEDDLNEGFGPALGIDDLRGHPYEEFKNKKNAPSYDRWYAAQLPDPEEDEHGMLPSAEVIQYPGARSYLKDHQVHGIYPDGEVFELGPYSAAICREYINLHKLSKNSRTFAKMAKDKFKNIKWIDVDADEPREYGIVKLPDGFYLKEVDGHGRIGPFDNKQLARMYAFVMDLELQKSKRGEHTEEVQHINYPTWVFTYKMRGEDCADIVVAENDKAAMKLFDFQWHIFDGTRPFKSVFNNIEELRRDLRPLHITDIEMLDVDDLNAEEMFELAEDLGNPSEKANLMKFCRNPRFKYILGRDVKTGRSPVTIRW